MREKSKVVKPDYKKLIPEYADNEILEILKKHKLYQKEAAELAIEEAIKRGLINSEQDLFAEEFNNTTLSHSLFPEIEDVNSKRKISKSIARVLFIVGILPTVWGIISISDNKRIEGGIITIAGLLWLYFSTLLIRKPENKTINSIFVLLGLACFYIIKLFLNLKSVSIMDVFIPIVLFGLILYGLVFLRRLIS